MIGPGAIQVLIKILSLIQIKTKIIWAE
jgi:hypothetical protein